MTDTIRDALERLIELDDANSVLGVDPDITVWVDAIAAARAALAEQQGKLSPKELDHQPALSADDIPPGPFSEHELREQWNQQADEFNQWDSLDSCEQLAWAQARAIQRDRNARQPARLRNCPTHGQQPPEAWGCPECVRELREELATALPAEPTPPAVTISALLRPAYEPGGSEADGAQVVDLEWWQPVMGCDSLQMVVDNVRNILSSRWSSPAPIPVAKGDVGGLVAWLLEEAEQAANSDASHSAGMLTWAAQVVGEHAELLQQQQAEIQRLKDELADERMRLFACFNIAICDTPETAPKARNEYREHYWSPAAEAIAQKIDELIRLRKRFNDEADRLFYSLLNAVEALKRLRKWARLCGGRYNADVVLGVVDWIDGGMVGELPPLPSHALFTHEKS